jgi:hypothetical protein
MELLGLMGGFYFKVGWMCGSSVDLPPHQESGALSAMSVDRPALIERERLQPIPPHPFIRTAGRALGVVGTMLGVNSPTIQFTVILIAPIGGIFVVSLLIVVPMMMRKQYSSFRFSVHR